MKLGSLFDGSGGFPLAGALCGIEPVWASEVEPYPIAVTKTRFPYMNHLGDISKINGAEIEPIVSVNIYAFLKAQKTGKPVELCCAIGDETIDGKPYEDIVEIARNYIRSIGGFEKFAEWGLF